METENQFNLGRQSEITRDEVKFSKFIKRLRTQFTHFFTELLEIHLALTGVTTRKEWKEMERDVYFDFTEDNFFTELKEAEIMRERLQILGDIDTYTGNYFSKEWIRKHVLRMTEEDIIDIRKQIKKEMSDPDEEPAGEEGEDSEGPPEPKSDDDTDLDAEEFVPSKKITEEEKKLVESMTKFMDSMITEDKE